MAVLLRALVMLLVLVGLPAAWVYYGPLPPQAQGVVDRVVDVAREAVGWDHATKEPTISCGIELDPSTKYYDPSVLQVEAHVPLENNPPIAVEDNSPETATTPTPSLQEQLAPQLEQLRAQGAIEYALEKWGNDGQLYRFRCALPLAGSNQLTQHFEAIHQEPGETISQVLAEVTRWQSARVAATQYR